MGLGKIGRAVARKAKAFGLQVKAYDPYLSESEMNLLDLESVEFGDLVSTADFISLHVPINEETHHLIDAGVFDSIKDALAKGEKVSLVGFGSFSVKERKAREGRNPRTGKPLKIAAKTVPVFKAGKALKDAV